MKLPFLQESKWPTSKEPAVRIVNPSHDHSLQDSLIDEILVAVEKDDVRKFREAIEALVYAIRNEDTKDDV